MVEVRADPPTDDPVQLGDIVPRCAPDPLVVDAVICVVNDDPHALDLGPGQLARAGDELARQLCRDVAETPHDRLAREAERSLAVPTILAEGDPLGGVDRFSQVLENLLGVPARSAHRSIASSRMRRCRGLRPPVEITSTCIPSKASRSCVSPTWSRSDASASKSTSKSTSLDGLASPRATEPNTRTRDAWRRRATARIASRRVDAGGHQSWARPPPCPKRTRTGEGLVGRTDTAREPDAGRAAKERRREERFVSRSAPWTNSPRSGGGGP